MSEELKRFKRNYMHDGWPIEDTSTNRVLESNDLVIVLNDYESQLSQYKAHVDRLTKLAGKCLMLAEQNYSCSKNFSDYANEVLSQPPPRHITGTGGG